MAGGSPIRVLGVCGGIGSGKSQACKILVEKLGCLAHIEADSLAHQVYRPKSPVVQEIVNAFGSHMVNKEGEVDRKQLGSVVFGNPESLSKLEKIVWPHVWTEVSHILEGHRSRPCPSEKRPIVILEAAVLMDAEWHKHLDGTWVVTAPLQVAQERLVSQRGFSLEDAQQRIASQESRRGIGNLQKEVENRSVTAVIANDSNLDNLEKKLRDALDDPSCWNCKETTANQIGSS
eukprot:CAMPEP_0116841222 /NCGR_PEP_ID=MMETSP0418-20121206/10802_1 /TAXON_ID=1158023 /ORGANISM="Astrosyne radiata, Strain 13vi08-1A" /LENGTH=232 /DNA_ID=CAMNT_0004471619 /DNA_START=125 /DNA_END=823 /DNA_ORIENTATION=+